MRRPCALTRAAAVQRVDTRCTQAHASLSLPPHTHTHTHTHTLTPYRSRTHLHGAGLHVHHLLVLDHRLALAVPHVHGRGGRPAHVRAPPVGCLPFRRHAVRRRLRPPAKRRRVGSAVRWCLGPAVVVLPPLGCLRSECISSPRHASQPQSTLIDVGYWEAHLALARA
jgi:hypothetical protein